MARIIFSVLILLILSEIFVVEGFYIQNRNELKKYHHERIKRNSDLDDYSKFGDILNFWNKFKDRLNDGGIVGSDDDVDAEVVEEDKFNELELLQMIPKIIDNYRTNKLTIDEKLQLSKIYGNLWTIITEEAERKQNEEMNPLLKALFDSFYLTKDITNDIDHNTVMEVTKKPLTGRTSLAMSSLSGLNGLPISSGSSRKLFLNVNKSDHPSQRLLNVAAMLIHQAIHSRRRSQHQDNYPSSSIDSSGSSLIGVDAKNKRRPYKILLPSATSQKRKATLNLQLTDIPIQKITRTKRNVNIHFSGNDQNSIQNSRIDALLKIFNNKGPSGYLINSVFDDDDDDAENEDVDYLNENENDKDYSYDDFYEDGEEVHNENLSSGSNEAASVGEEYGSFQDLMLLAERHRLRREMEEERLKQRGINRNFLTATKN